jgi:hypothetical protein
MYTIIRFLEMIQPVSMETSTDEIEKRKFIFSGIDSYDIDSKLEIITLHIKQEKYSSDFLLIIGY